MAKQEIIKNMFVYTVLIIAIVREAETACCGVGTSIEYYHPDDNLVNSITICMDGNARRDYYCGVGECNPLGCNCVGGCRNNPKGTFQEAKRIFLEKNDLTEHVQS